jgi:hypothetical protein
LIPEYEETLVLLTISSSLNQEKTDIAEQTACNSGAGKPAFRPQFPTPVYSSGLLQQPVT